ncbi:3-ketoacyl-CoA synthase 15 [Vigna radiata var. radiata]|uniref:3-ketoacyl-CoA synthase n=1 Tax=Vigna radiata var. radiata TaxID=3916 RepID=A0A1S3VIZ5_VIGRR|nr:3-ketoacyl-CoA synthase 15 [Vigna radiata var. radiata]
MSKESEDFSTEIVQRGLENSGPNAGSISFSVRVRPRLPDFLSSVNLKYVKLGYGYLISHRLYLLLAPPLLAIFIARIAKFTWHDLYEKYGLIEILFISALLFLLLYFYVDLTPGSTYLLDFSCFRPSNEYKISKAEFIELAKKSGNFNDTTIEFQERVLKKSGIGDETYLPKGVFRPGYRNSLKDGRQEVSMVMFGAINDVLAATKVKPKDITILIVNCGILNTTPSLSSMIVNHFKLRHDIHSFNLGGMGCGAGITAIDLAKDLLDAYPRTYALVVSTEAVSSTWYSGNDIEMQLPNCFFRMGAAAIVLSNFRLDRWRAKYELKQLVRIHRGMDNRSYKSIYQKEDSEGRKGVYVSKDIIEVGGHALKANITTLGPLVLPVSEQLHFFTNLIFKKKKRKPYIPDYKLAFEHTCILATSKKVLDEIQKNLELTEEYMEASRKTLERFGNTSSSSIWYELAYLEFNSRIKRGDRVCQIASGAGFMCNSVVWKALRNVRKPNHSPWIQDQS